jgi:hypothetical protein
MSTEDQLRRALHGIAPQAPADDDALAGVLTAVTRRRRRQSVGRIAAACALLGVAAAGVALARAGAGDPPVVQTPSHPGPTGSDRSPGTTGPGDRVGFGRITFVLPPGWEVVDDGSAGGPMCVAPAGNPEPRWDGCAGLLLYRGDDLPGYEGRPYEKGGPWGFYHGTDPVPCPGGQDADDTVEPGAVGTAPIDSGLAPVGEHRADYDQWFARCSASSFTFTPRAWLLPTSRVVIFDVLGRPETDAILASVQFS